MSRKTVPILLSSIASLFLLLVIIMVWILLTPDFRQAADQRSDALKVLLSRNSVSEEAGVDSLYSIAAYIRSPLSQGGSIDNLSHFLSKDPGRSEFPGAADRKRAEVYLRGLGSGKQPELIPGELPRWVPSYIKSVDFLIEAVKKDIFSITGFPSELTFLDYSGTGEDSAILKAEKAVGRFGDYWIPSGETRSTYSTDRKMIRDHLIGNRRFLKRMAGIDNAWASLAAALYNLSVDKRLKTAIAYAPALEEEFDELIIMILSADLHRRGQDLMIRIPDREVEPGEAESPGILWMPEMSYYKNIPELTGYTADEEPTIYFARVSIGYSFRDSRTQTWLNRRKDWLSDYFNSAFSRVVIEDFSPVNPTDLNLTAWKASRLKAENMHGINKRIIPSLAFGAKGVFGVRDLALVRVNMLKTPNASRRPEWRIRDVAPGL